MISWLILIAAFFALQNSIIFIILSSRAENITTNLGFRKSSTSFSQILRQTVNFQPRKRICKKLNFVKRR